MATFNIQGRVVRPSSSLGVPGAKVKAYQLGQTAPIVEAVTALDGSFNVSFPWASGRPDVHFKVTQTLNGAETEIYNENPATQTRFNIADVLAVTLKTDAGLALVSPPSGRPYDSLFVFTRVGITGVNEIDTTGAAPSGYARPDTSPAAPNSADANAPFGSTLDIAGWFGQFCDVYRYKVQYSADGGITWHDVSDPLANSYYEFALGGGNWVTMAMGPFAEGGQINVYKLPYIERPGQPWIFVDQIARWDTTKVPDGLYTLRLLGFRVGPDGTTLLPAASLLIDPAYGTLHLRVDNQPPVSRIVAITHTPAGGSATPIQVCDIVPFSNGRLSFQIEASDAQGHLRGYSLAALFGHNLLVTPPPAAARDDYSAHIGPSRHWSGGPVTVEYDGTIYPASKMPTCAYQFRLDVAKRTTNGYGLIYDAVEDTVHITLKRP
jgi:hypothetical protein